jgi:hypothetical protein
MRLFEVDLGSARDVLAVLQGLADKEGQESKLPFPVVMNMLKPFGLGISTPDALIALKNSVDPNGDVIKDIADDGTVTLNTKVQGAQTSQDQPAQGTEPGAGSSSVDAMASANSKNLSSNL